jgi:hypothetical protein
MRQWPNMWADWCSEHPMTVFYLLVVGTLNVILNIIELFVR